MAGSTRHCVKRRLTEACLASKARDTWMMMGLKIELRTECPLYVAFRQEFMLLNDE